MVLNPLDLSRESLVVSRKYLSITVGRDLFSHANCCEGRLQPTNVRLKSHLHFLRLNGVAGFNPWTNMMLEG
jgi:hypothetical protein